MKRNSLFKTAGLALALASLPLPATLAQSAGAGGALNVYEAGSPKNRSVQRVEIETDDNGNPIAAMARSALGDVNRIFATQLGVADQPLIITTSAPDEKSIDNLQEDIAIMARVLGKAAGRGGSDDERKAMNIHLWAIGSGSMTGARNMYIEGQGAVFILNVNMPLVAAQTKAQAEEKKEAASSTWEEARAELFGGGDDLDRKRSRVVWERGSHAFSQERFDDLKSGLIEALKNATHIRGLKENEFVTVVVQGPGHELGAVRAWRSESGKSASAFAFAGSDAGGPSRSVLTLRANKGDIDAFARGRIDSGEFRKRVASSTYQIAGGGNAIERRVVR